MKLVHIQLALLLAFFLTTDLVKGQRRPQGTTPIEDASVCFTAPPGRPRELVRYVADDQNACMYWQCLSFRGRARLIERPCGLGTRLSDFYGVGSTNPCTDSYPDSAEFQCTRKKFLLSPSDERPCVTKFENEKTCKNNGKIVFESGICSCDCTGTGFADWDCTKRPEDLGQGGSAGTPGSDDDDPCPGGEPRTDFCQDHREQFGEEPCENNGRCQNQCLGFVCQCTPPFTAGRRCEEFRCQDNVECLNGGTCMRGEDGNSQFATCQCQTGFTGRMCEIEPPQ